MGGILDTPHTEKRTETGDGNQCRFAVCSMQGWRVEMEDAHCAQIGLPELKDWNFFAVFDGHAGGFVSEHCSENLLPSLLGTEEFHQLASASLSAFESGDKFTTSNEEDPSTRDYSSTSRNGNNDNNISPDPASENSESGNESPEPKIEAATAPITELSHVERALAAVRACVPDVPSPSKEWKNSSNPTLESLKANIRAGFLKLDEKLRQQPNIASGKDISGSTAVAALISPTHYIFANCGDSRALLSRRGHGCIFSTQDHKPSNPEEKDRIQKAGGSVMIHRVNGSLAVSRALGDFQYKQVADRKATEQLVSPEPEVTILPRSEDDEFIVLACDGVWDVMKNEEVVDYVRHQLKIESDLDKVCSSLIDTCLHKGSTDNMSVILVTFPGAPQPDEEVRRLDNELNNEIERHVSELLRTDGEFQSSIYLLMNTLKNIKIPNLPPGGGLESKRSLIEKAQKEFIRQNCSENDVDHSVPL